MNKPDFDIAIIGGGIIGLTIAFKLAYHLHNFNSPDPELKHLLDLLKKSSGKLSLPHPPAISLDSNLPLRIVVLDEHNFTSSASYQATGILATYGATHYLSPLRRQIVESTRLYPHLLSQLEEVLEAELLKAGTTAVKYTHYCPTPHYHLYDNNNILHTETKVRKLRRLAREQAIDWKEYPNLPQALYPFLPQTLESTPAIKNDSHVNTASKTSNLSALSFASHTILPPRLLALLMQAGKKLGVEYVHGKLKHLKPSSQTKTEASTITYTSLQNAAQHPPREVTCTSGLAVLATGNATPGVLQTAIQHPKNQGYQFKLKELWGALMCVKLDQPIPELNSVFNEHGLLLNLYDKKYLWANPHGFLSGAISSIISNTNTDNQDNQGELLFGSMNEKRSFTTEIHESEKEIKENHPTPLPGVMLEEENVKHKLLYELKRTIPNLAVKENSINIRQGGRLFSADKKPLLGFLEDNLLLATGYYKSGLALAPLHSRLAVEMTLTKWMGIEKSKLQYSEEVEFLNPIRERGIQIVTNMS